MGGGQTEETAPLFSFEVAYYCLVIETSPPFLLFIAFSSFPLEAHSNIQSVFRFSFTFLRWHPKMFQTLAPSGIQKTVFLYP